MDKNKLKKELNRLSIIKMRGLNDLLNTSIDKRIEKIQKELNLLESQELKEKTNSYKQLLSKTNIEYYKNLSDGTYIVPSVHGETAFTYSEMKDAGAHGLDILKITKHIRDLFGAKRVNAPFEEKPKQLGIKIDGI